MNKSKRLISKTKSRGLEKAINEAVVDDFSNDVSLQIVNLTKFLEWVETVKPEETTDTKKLIRFQEQLNSAVSSLMDLKETY